MPCLLEPIEKPAVRAKINGYILSIEERNFCLGAMCEKVY